MSYFCIVPFKQSSAHAWYRSDRRPQPVVHEPEDQRSAAVDNAASDRIATREVIRGEELRRDFEAASSSGWPLNGIH